MQRGQLPLCILLFFAGPPFTDGLSAQTPRRVGGWAGQTSSRHLRDDGLATGWRKGYTAGVFLETQTPLPFLLVRVELGYQGRGSTVWDSLMDPSGDSRAEVTSHYLGAQIHGRFRLAMGPLGVYLFGGPTVEQLLKTGCSEALCPSLGEGVPMVWGVAGGGGVDVALPRGVQVGLEFRWEEGLSNSYRVDVLEVRSRSRGVQLRVGFTYD